MNKLLEVREYDTIIKNENYKDYGNYKYLEKKMFDDLSRFIHEFTADEENSDAIEFMRIGCKRNIGDVICIRNYVGLIQMKNGFQIQILPKIDFGEPEDGNQKTKKVFLKMLRSLKSFPSKVFNDASLKVDKMNLYEVFINMYLQEVRHLVKRGIRSDYVIKEENQCYYKGKLMVGKHTRVNLTHKERFFISYDDFNPNGPENRLVKATLLRLHKLSTSAENKKEIMQLLTAFELVDISINYEKDFSKVVINRNTKNYEKLMLWSKVFLMNKSFTTFTGTTNTKALLFPMESVYESYVAQQIKKIFSSFGWYISIQDKGYYLFIKPKKQFALKPDIVIRKGERTIVLDTKWKRLVNNERINYGISQADMYQMYAYSKKYNTPEVWLLYPINDDIRNYSDIIFISDDGVKVRLFFVDVANIEESLLMLSSLINDSEENKNV